MKASPLSTALILLPAALVCAEIVPVAFPASRYEKMLADSPFVLATPAVPVEDKTKGWAANLYLGPVWRIVRDGEEREYAVIRSRGDVSGSFTLTGHEEGPDGIQLVSIQWADDITKTTATVKKGTEVETLQPDQSAAPPPVPQAPQASRPNGQIGAQPPRPNGQPGFQANGALNTARRPGAPGVPQPGGVPRPSAVLPAGNAVPAAGQYNQNKPNTANDKTRIRVINSK